MSARRSVRLLEAKLFGDGPEGAPSTLLTNRTFESQLRAFARAGMTIGERSVTHALTGESTCLHTVHSGKRGFTVVVVTSDSEEWRHTLQADPSAKEIQVRPAFAGEGRRWAAGAAYIYARENTIVVSQQDGARLTTVLEYLNQMFRKLPSGITENMRFVAAQPESSGLKDILRNARRVTISQPYHDYLGSGTRNDTSTVTIDLETPSESLSRAFSSLMDAIRNRVASDGEIDTSGLRLDVTLRAARPRDSSVREHIARISSALHTAVAGDAYGTEVIVEGRDGKARNFSTVRAVEFRLDRDSETKLPLTSSFHREAQKWLDVIIQGEGAP